MQELFQVWGKELISFVILLPIVWFFIKETQRQNLRIATSLENHMAEDKESDDKLIETLNSILNSLKEHSEETKNHFLQIQKNFVIKSLTKDQTIELIKKSVLSGSYKKLDYLEKRLSKNNLEGRESIIKRQIEVELIKLSGEEYLEFLANFRFGDIKLNQLVEKHFKFKEFLDELFDAFFDKKNDTNKRLKNILEVMRFYHSEMIEDIKKDITNQ